MLGLNASQIEKILEQSDVTDEKLVQAIKNVILENNKEIEDNLLRTVDEQVKRESRRYGRI